MDRLCIEILEQAERRDSLLGEASMSLAIAGLKLIIDLSVALATSLLFPMDIAVVDESFKFHLNEAPFKIKEEYLDRLRALSKLYIAAYFLL
ncbi:hypothetical protein SASPL_126582 [Salvia splendens]|uniref:NPR1/NIM1-like C-terminal domain-containing protein n=1 Tax=Salvia splendens TaxID=180675 RepID=A0A8X8ZQ63_SALSN|nr:hypothetical protein SASPL_126582 [Salvia splendens]